MFLEEILMKRIRHDIKKIGFTLTPARPVSQSEAGERHWFNPPHFSRRGVVWGFTLVEILVVIAIIGILATIVLLSLNAARAKAKDATIKAAVEQVRQVAELFYDDHSNTYSGFDDQSDGSTYDLIELERIKTSIAENGGSFVLKVDGAGNKYCAQSAFTSGGDIFCVDNTGFIGSGALDCDDTNITCAAD